MMTAGAAGIAADDGLTLTGSEFCVFAGLDLLVLAAGFGLRLSAKGFLATPVMAFAALVTSVDRFCFEGGLATSVAVRLLAIGRVGAWDGGEERFGGWRVCG